MTPLSSSIRECSPEETLRLAEPFARRLGVIRVCDATQLDRVGLPVFTSIRPGADPDSLSVHAGKGMIPVEARVGATMEAIEFAIAERPRAPLATVCASPEEVYGLEAPDRVLEFCPTFGARVPLDRIWSWYALEDLCSGQDCPVPAELVLFPTPAEVRSVTPYGSSTNGLASGNSVEEATVHALLEVIERDIESHRLLRDCSVLVDTNLLPERIRDLEERLRGRSLRLFVRVVANPYGIPYFCAFIVEGSMTEPMFASEGFGCHPVRDIALHRAITEAAQSRLSFIHGGRDDIVDRYERFAGRDAARVAFNRSLLDRISREGRHVSLGEIADALPEAPPTDLLRRLLALVGRCGFDRVLRQVLSATDDPVAVVRVVVPRMESLNSVTRRVGPRLADHVRSVF